MINLYKSYITNFNKSKLIHNNNNNNFTYITYILYIRMLVRYCQELNFKLYKGYISWDNTILI